MRPSLVDLSLAVGRFAQGDGLGQPVDADDARQRADDILSRAEYQEPGDSLLDRILGWIGDQISRLFFEGSGSGARNAIAYVLVIGVVALVAWVVIKAVRVPGGAGVTSEPEVTYGTDSMRSPAVWQDEADRLAAAGDHRGALRCRHQALIATWITDGVIDHVVGRTAAECHAAAGGGELSRRVVETFDAVWYGGAPVGPRDYESFADDCGRLAAADRVRLAESAT